MITMYDPKEIVDAALRAGFGEAVASVHSDTRRYLKITDSKVDSVVTMENESASLFLTKSKRIVFTNIDVLTPESVNRSIAHAAKSIMGLPPKDDYNGIAEGPFKYKKAVQPDKRIPSCSDSELEDIAYSAINSALANGARRVAGMLLVSGSSLSMSTSKNASAAGSDSFIQLSLRAFSREFSAQETAASKRLGDLGAERFAKRVAELSSSVSKHSRIQSGKYDILYLQPPAGALLSSVDEMACMGNVETGSFLAGKLGKRVASRRLSIYDDGASEDAIGSSSFDDEGHPTQRTPIIRAGVLRSYLHNASTAKKYKTESTGNAGLMNPSPTTTVVDYAGARKGFDALVRSIDKGILVTNLWYTRFSNYLTGDFSTVPRDLALYIEKGEPKFAIRQMPVSSSVGIRISENIIRMLQNISAATSDTIQTTTWETEGVYYFTPSILVDGVSVTTA